MKLVFHGTRGGIKTVRARPATRGCTKKAAGVPAGGPFIIPNPNAYLRAV